MADPTRAFVVLTVAEDIVGACVIVPSEKVKDWVKVPLLRFLMFMQESLTRPLATQVERSGFPWAGPKTMIPSCFTTTFRMPERLAVDRRSEKRRVFDPL